MPHDTWQGVPYPDNADFPLHHRRAPHRDETVVAGLLLVAIVVGAVVARAFVWLPA